MDSMKSMATSVAAGVAGESRGNRMHHMMSANEGPMGKAQHTQVP